MSCRRISLSILIVAGSLLLGSGCDDEDEPTTTSAPVETADKLPKLPDGWVEYRNRQGGYAIGVPLGWSAKRRGARTELLSPEQLAAVSVTVDRTDEVLGVRLEQLASATISAGVPGLEEVEPGEPRRLGHHYDAVTLKATGVGGADNVDERLLLAVVRREGIATFTILAAVNAENHPHFYDDEIKRMIRSLRSQPILPIG